MVSQDVANDAQSSAASSPAHGLLLIVALATAAAAQGAYYVGAQGSVAVVLAVAVLVALRKQPWSWRELWRAPIAMSCAMLAVWALMASALAGGLSGATPTVALLAGVVAVVLVCRRIPSSGRETLVWALLAIGVLVAATGWAGVAWRFRPWALEDQGLWRAATTLTYANAAAGFLVPLALLGLASLTVAPRSPLRAVAASALLVGVGATASRGGLLALAVGIGVLAGLLGLACVARASSLAVLGAAPALGALLPSMSAASAPRPALAVVGLVVGLAAVSLLSLVSGRGLTIAIAVAGALLIAVIASDPPFRRAVEAIRGPRLTARSSDRAQEAAAAWRLVANRPLSGVGSGGATLSWAAPDGRVLVARYAHNEYLQVFVELGAIGLALLCGVLGSIGVTVWRGRSFAPSTEIWAGVAAALAALAVHSGFDFLWHIPVIPLTAAVLVGLVSQHQQSTPEKEQS